MSEPVPPTGYSLVRCIEGKFEPAIPCDAFKTLMVWSGDLGQWVKPSYIPYPGAFWFCIKAKRAKAAK